MSFKHQIENIGRHLEELVSLPKSADPERIAQCVKAMMDRMDHQLDEDTRNKVMALSGFDCISANKRAVDQAVKRRQKYSTLEEYLEAEEKHPSRGTRFRREGDVYYQWYTPHEWSKPMRCFCSLMKGLPEGIDSSKTFCKCSESFVKAVWETVLEQPVIVKALETAISGSDECRFEIKKKMKS
jgi:hypothetical protein